MHRTANEADELLRQQGLNPAQFQLLLAAHRQPGSTQRALGEHLAVTVSNVSMLVTKLERAGLLRREAQGASNRVWLTRRGQDLVARLSPEHDTFMAQRFIGLDDAELATLHTLMEKAWLGLPPST